MSFYGRTEELNTLEKWIIQDQCRLITILGLPGAGKTSLVLHLIDSIKTQFQSVIYRSLCFSPTLDTTLTNILQILSQSSDIASTTDAKLCQLLNSLRQHRCLLIFDDIETLFASRKLAGQYKSGYEDYQLFFKQIAEISNSSCVILISSEKPREICHIKKESYPVHSLILRSLGMASKNILQEYQLSDEEHWESLINAYEGNPLWLEITATLIQELFTGRVSEFCQYNSLILDESIQNQLNQQFERLTDLELLIITEIAQENQPTS